MSNLYNETICNHVAMLEKEKIIKPKDTIHFFCGFYDNEDICYRAYSLVYNGKHNVQIGFPSVSNDIPSIVAYSLSPPEIEENYIVIAVLSYVVEYKEGTINCIFNGSTLYYYIYNSKGKRYVLSHTKELGI